MNTKATKKIVGLKELRENMETYIKRVNKGESITVFRRLTPLFTLSPVDTEEIGWETIADFTTLKKEGVSARDILASIKKIHG